MPPSIVVVIREDPERSHRAVEALRIALGLSTGSNPLTVVLLERSPMLLTEDAADAVDADLLEKHLPVVQELEIPIWVPEGTHSRFKLDPAFSAKEVSQHEISRLINRSDRILVF